MQMLLAHVAGEAASYPVPRAFHLSVSSTPHTAVSSQGLSLSGSTVTPITAGHVAKQKIT